MSVTAKICGLTTSDTLDAAIGGGASHVGFNFYAPSPRNLSLDVARALGQRTPERVKKVGVFVDPDDALLDATIPAAGLDAVQLHNTPPDRVAAIGRRGLPVWVAVAIKTRTDFDAVAKYRGAADKILYDAKTPDGALPGGMGVRFDWRLLDDFRHPLPWALSGGLTPDNLAEAVRQTAATLVDVSSGVETSPGVKDVEKIAAFLGALAAI